MHNGQEELRSSVQCAPKPGCRKIEIRDECCPVYKCGKCGISMTSSIRNTIDARFLYRLPVQ